MRHIDCDERRGADEGPREQHLRRAAGRRCMTEPAGSAIVTGILTDNIRRTVL